MSNADALLAKLKEREAKLKAKIKEAKAAAAKEAAALEAEKHRLIGAAVMAEMDTNEALRKIVEPLLEASVQGTRARKLLGLDTTKAPEGADPNRVKQVLRSGKDPKTERIDYIR